MLKRLNSYYKDSESDRTYAYVFHNTDTDMFEVHFYDTTVKSEPPTGLFLYYEDALTAAKEWTT